MPVWPATEAISLLPRKGKITLSPKHVGTAIHKYKLQDPAQQRRNAIAAGIRHREKYRNMNTRTAVINVKMRMNVLRIYRKNTRDSTCHAIESDMRWIDEHYGYGGETKNVCREPMARIDGSTT